MTVVLVLVVKNILEQTCRLLDSRRCREICQQDLDCFLFLLLDPFEDFCCKAASRVQHLSFHNLGSNLSSCFTQTSPLLRNQAPILVLLEVDIINIGEVL